MLRCASAARAWLSATGSCSTLRLVRRVSLLWICFHHSSQLLLWHRAITCPARPQALRRRASSGWPMSIHSVIWPVRSLTQISGSSASDKPRVKAMPSCAFRAYISTRAIMRSSVSDGCRASVRLCSA